MTHSQHIAPVRTYAIVFLALMLLLALTVAAAQIEHGVLNLFVGLSIAVIKAGLIVLYFMHVRYNSFVIRLAVVAGFLWLVILMTLTMCDYLTRTEAKVVGTSPKQTRASFCCLGMDGSRSEPANKTIPASISFSFRSARQRHQTGRLSKISPITRLQPSSA